MSNSFPDHKKIHLFHYVFFCYDMYTYSTSSLSLTLFSHLGYLEGRHKILISYIRTDAQLAHLLHLIYFAVAIVRELNELIYTNKTRIINSLGSNHIS
jgi:hypothetical protein